MLVHQTLTVSLFALVTALLSIPVATVDGFRSQQAAEQTTDSDNDYDEKQRIKFFEDRVKPILENSCLQCHGDDPGDLGGKLALISRKMILAGGESGPVVDLENPSKSLLLDAINYRTYEMPPDGKLTDDQIYDLTRWVTMGMPWTPKDADKTLDHSHASTAPQVNAETKSFWSFQRVSRPKIPQVTDNKWVRNDIDRFILAKLKSSGLVRAPPVSKTAFIRRAVYDLTGLPPTPSQVEKFERNDSESAYEDLIEELLNSPHYGEKWGRHWLDVVRYAESNSFERDGTKPFVWRYRDYVIRSFNDDKPYDQFLIEQLAGDELEQPTADAIIATGYYRLGQWDDEPADRKQALYDDLDDILATTSQAMIGLTINCARCHDHKIDPIPAKDYYQMLAFFRNVRRYGDRSHESVLEASSRQLEHEQSVAPDILKRFEQRSQQLQSALQEVEEIAKEDFEPVEHDEFQYEQNRVRIIRKRLENKVITQQQFDRYVRNRNELQRHLDNPPNLYRVLCVKEHRREPPPTHVLIRGNPNVEGALVEPGFVSVLSPPDPLVDPLPDNRSSGRRLALARWIANGDHPLTARVMVNRIWQHHFGRGIVRSTNDFGFQGQRPTHPQLLDYLADEFVNKGWSVKQLHRLIMNSSAYRMSGRFDARAYQSDPLNNLFWRFNPRRLTAEEIRDSILAVSGRLNTDKMYGPPVFTQLSKEVLSGQSMPGSGWGTSQEDDTRRRSIYIHVKRSLRVPLLASFDAADTDASCPERFNTTQPTQALGMLNSEFTNREAEAFADCIARNFDETEDQVREILLRITQRVPDDQEVQEGIQLIEQWQHEDGIESQQALAFFCLTAFNLNEFIFIE